MFETLWNCCNLNISGIQGSNARIDGTGIKAFTRLTKQVSLIIKR